MLDEYLPIIKYALHLKKNGGGFSVENSNEEREDGNEKQNEEMNEASNVEDIMEEFYYGMMKSMNILKKGDLTGELNYLGNVNRKKIFVECSLCKKEMELIKTVFCGNCNYVFCKDCVFKLYSSWESEGICPLCRNKFTLI
jgi:hypothetical protein